MSNSMTKENSNLTTKKPKKDEQIARLELPFIISILKRLSDKNHPLPIGKIKSALEELTGEVHSDKTLRRDLQALCALQEDSDPLVVNNLILTFGGLVVNVSNKTKQPAVKREQTRYYFQPLLDNADVSMICGAIASNRYLTEEEKDYLRSRERLMAPLGDSVKDISDALDKDEKLRRIFYEHLELPEKPDYTDNMLHHVNQLYDAIEKGYAIQMIYGIYDLADKNNSKPCFHARNQDPYILNPYAMIWNGGSYYLIATHKGHNNPVHFRVDRIIDLKPMPQQDDARLYEPREPQPASLAPYFRRKDEHTSVFLPEYYTATYPLMGIYDEADKLDCYLECTAGTLSILIDTFGFQLNIQPSPLPHDKNELDIHQNPQQFFAVQIPNVQYDNVLQFCLQQHASITALHPPKLVEDVESRLCAALERCRRAKANIASGHSMKKL